jgi:hypothetical protein
MALLSVLLFRRVWMLVTALETVSQVLENVMPGAVVSATDVADWA